MDPIVTHRRTVRNFTVDDWRDLHEMVVVYQASDVAQYDHRWPTGEAEVRGVAEWFATGDDFLAVELRESGKLIGMVALNADPNGPPNLGYVLNFDHHGRGYATEACDAVLRRAFEDLGHGAVVSGTAPQNGPSCRLLARLGFVPTADDPNAYVLTREAWARARARRT